MSAESSAKSSAKKGFKAPILQASGDALTEPTNSLDSFAVKAMKTADKKEHELERQEKKLEHGKQAPQKRNKLKKKHEEAKFTDREAPCPEKKIKMKKVNKTNTKAENDTSIKEKKSKKKLKETSEEGETCLEKDKKIKKPEVSLSDSQYEEIFKAVLRNPSHPNTPIEDLLEAVASLSEKSSVKDCQKESLAESEESVKTSGSMKERKLPIPQLSPWGSHISKQNSQASSILKELQQSQASSLLSPEPTSSSDETGPDGDADVVLSQKSVRTLSQRSYTQPRPRSCKVDKRPALEHLQTKRNVGLWVYCDRMTCQKQRYLPNVTDPQELPDVWYCHMNPDPKYKSCSSEEQQPSVEEEEDMIFNQFTCGSVVWAHVTGFPWWPAMVDDDPDLECYYWLLEDMRTVTFYHVVFFDKNEVTRAWIPINKIVPFKKNLNSFKRHMVRGIDFTARIQVAKEQAQDAVAMTVFQRLKKFSFIARYRGPIFDDQEQIEKTMKKYNLKCSIGKTEAGKRGRKRCAKASEDKITPFDKTVKTSPGKKYQKQGKLLEIKDRKTLIQDSADDDSDTNIEVAEIARSLLEEGSKNEPPSSLENTPLKSHGSDLIPEADKQKKCSTPETSMKEKEKVTKENDEFDASETPSGIVFDSKLNSTEGTVENLEEKDQSEPSLATGTNVSQGSKLHRSKPATLQEESLGSEIEPSQVLERSRDEDEASQTKLSQSTIADFLAAESEDAVVPEGSFSQQSEPFEE